MLDRRYAVCSPSHTRLVPLLWKADALPIRLDGNTPYPSTVDVEPFWREPNRQHVCTSPTPPDHHSDCPQTPARHTTVQLEDLCLPRCARSCLQPSSEPATFVPHHCHRAAWSNAD